MVLLNGSSLTIDQLVAIATRGETVAVEAEAAARTRSRVPTLEDDRPPAPDIAAIAELIATSHLENACGVVVK